MPDLEQLLHDAVPMTEPGFDTGAVRARLAGVERRRRRVAVAAMAGVVAVLAFTVANLQIAREDPVDVADPPTAPLLRSDLPELTPLSQWPAVIEFAGVRVAVAVFDEPDEPIQSRVPLRAGHAGLNSVPSGLHELGNTAMQAFVNRVWFGCGTDQVVRMMEDGPATGAPAFDGPGSSRWLPAGALIEASEQLARRMGCVPVLPTGSWEVPDAAFDLAPVRRLAASIDEAGLPTCCADPVPLETGGSTRWSVLVEDDVLPLTIGERDWHLPIGEPVEKTTIVGGSAVVNSEGQLAVTCFDTTTITVSLPTTGEEAGFGTFLDMIGCQPTMPAHYVQLEVADRAEQLEQTRSEALLLASSRRIQDQWLDAGFEVVGESERSLYLTLPDTAAVELEVEIVPVTALPEDLPGTSRPFARGTAQIDDSVPTLWFTCDDAIVLVGAAGPVANDVQLDAFLDAAEAASESLTCLPAAPGRSTPLGTTSRTTPADQPHAGTAAFIATVQQAGLEVTTTEAGHGAGAFEFEPSAAGSRPVSFEVDTLDPPPDDPGWPLDAATPLLPLADGEAAILDDGRLAFHCNGVSITVDGPESDGTEIAWVTELTAAAGEALVQELGCEPQGAE